MTGQFPVEAEQKADESGGSEPQDQFTPGEDGERVGTDHN